MENDKQAHKKFPLKVGVVEVTWPLQFLAVRSAILATAWLLVLSAIVHVRLLLWNAN